MNIAMISSWHVHAKGYAKKISELPGCKITAVWDENEDDGAAWADTLECRYFSDYDTLLAAPDIDAVVINSSTALHKDLIIKAADAKKHIFTEKVLAFTEEDCIAIKEAVKRNNVKFCIAFPHKCNGYLLKAKQMVTQGALGEITYARVRNAHNGSSKGWLPAHFYNRAQTGGGAMIDLGAHTIYLLNWLVGEPQNIKSVFTNVNRHEVEDNAVCVMSFENGAIGVAETSFVSTACPLTVELCGTKGSLLYRGTLSYANDTTENKWVTADPLEPLPEPLVQWVGAVRSGDPMSIDIDEAVILTRVMERAYAAL